jgi:hypothetical protein
MQLANYRRRLLLATIRVAGSWLLCESMNDYHGLTVTAGRGRQMN